MTTATAEPPTSLEASLKTSLAKDGKAGFNLDISIGGLGAELANINPAFADLDLEAINTAIRLLQNADFSSVGAAAQEGAEQAAQLLEHLPDADDLITELAAALIRLVGGADARAAAVLKQIEDGARALARRLRIESAIAPNPDVGAGAARLADVLDIVASVASTPLLALLPLAFPTAADTALDAWTELSDQAAGAVALLKSLDALGVIDALSRQALALERLLKAPIDLSGIEAAVARLTATTADEIIAALKRLKLDDAAAVALVRAPILGFADDVQLLGRLLDTALSGGIQTLSRADLTALVSAIEAAGAGLLSAGVGGVGDLARALRKRLDPLLAIKLPQLSIGQSGVAHMTASVKDAADDVAAVDPERFAKPITDGLKVALGPLHEVRIAAERIAAAIETAINAFAAAVGKLDLGAVAQTLRSALAPIADALARVRAALKVVQDQIRAAAVAITNAVRAVSAKIKEIFDAIRAAFERVGGALSDAKLDEIVAALRAGVEQVATVLRAAPLKPFIDTAVGILNTAGDILAAVPKDLLPAEVREKLDEATEEIEKLHFDDIADDLHAELKGIVNRVGGSVLAELDEVHADLVAFLAEIDPRKRVAALEAEHFDALVGRLHDIDVERLLAPVADALDEIQDALGGFDPKTLLAPLEAAFDQVEAGFAALDPKQLLTPLAQGAADVRKTIDEALPIADAIKAVTTADKWVAAKAEKVEPTFLGVLDAIFDALVSAIRELACETGLLAGTAKGLLSSLDLDVALASVGTGWKWVIGSDGATVVAERIGALVDAVNASAQSLERFALDTLVADLARTHKAIVAAVDGDPQLVGTDLRAELDAILSRCDPTVIFAGLAGQRTQHRTAHDAALLTLRRIHGSSWTTIGTLTTALRKELQPLVAVSEKLKELLDWLGADPTAGLQKSLNDLLAQVRPSTILAPLATQIGVLAKKIADLIRNGVLAPVLVALRDVQGLVALIDVPIPPALTDLHAHLAADIDELRPTKLLGGTLDAVQATVDELKRLDPMDEVEDVANELKAAIEQLMQEARPTVLFAPVFDVYDRVEQTVADLNVHALIQPVLDALDDLADQLADGLTEAGEALAKLQAACKSPGGLSIGVKVIS